MSDKKEVIIDGTRYVPELGEYVEATVGGIVMMHDSGKTRRFVELLDYKSNNPFAYDNLQPGRVRIYRTRVEEINPPPQEKR